MQPINGRSRTQGKVFTHRYRKKKQSTKKPLIVSLGWEKRVLLSGSGVDKRLTWSAFVPNNEVPTAARTLVGPKNAAVDEDLTVPSVLALVQHFLKDGEDGRWMGENCRWFWRRNNEPMTARRAAVTPKTTLNALFVAIGLVRRGDRKSRKKRTLESFAHFLEPFCFFGFI